MSIDTVEELRATGWDDLVDRLYAESWRESLARFRSRYAFRGMSRTEYRLTTSLGRLGRDTTQALEEPILRAFRKYAQGGTQLPGSSIWNWLALAQHHGLSTRLLDWTYSPLVAMHFATENERNLHADGVIWCVDYPHTNELLPEKLKQILQDEGSDVFTADMLEQAAGSLSAFDALAGEPFVAFFEPPSLDDRIVNQYALFSLVSDPSIDLGDWLREHPDMARCIVIPAELKLEIRDKLDQSNITERVLYPGLDGLCKWLNRYYAPRQVFEEVMRAERQTDSGPDGAGGEEEGLPGEGELAPA
ncbi:MAG TPA: FRG domain-containing protein [Chloroflexota bacterium]|nr:FRG domain-containing protein [Chloroflexota bacterium]